MGGIQFETQNSELGNSFEIEDVQKDYDNMKDTPSIMNAMLSGEVESPDLMQEK